MLPHGSSATSRFTSHCRHHTTSMSLKISSNFSLRLLLEFDNTSLTKKKEKGKIIRTEKNWPTNRKIKKIQSLTHESHVAENRPKRSWTSLLCWPEFVTNFTIHCIKITSPTFVDLLTERYWYKININPTVLHVRRKNNHLAAVARLLQLSTEVESGFRIKFSSLRWFRVCFISNNFYWFNKTILICINQMNS